MIIFLYVFLGGGLYAISLPFEPMENYHWAGYAYHTSLIFTFILIVSGAGD